MTTQKTVSKKAIHKKLLFIGVVVSLLAALIVWNPGGTIGSLASRMINRDTPLVDHQISYRLDLGDRISPASNNITFLNVPSDVAVHENKIFIVDMYHHQVKIYNLDFRYNDNGERVNIIPQDAPVKIIGNTDRSHGDYTNLSTGEGTEFWYPTDIVLDVKNNAFYVTDSHNHRVLKFDLTTYKLLAKIGGNTQDTSESHFIYPAGIAIDKNNNYLYVADGAYGTRSCRIKRFDLSNLLQTGQTTGGCGNAINELGSYYYGPNALAVDWVGNVYVADTYNDRIIKYDNKLENPVEILKSSNADISINNPTGLFIDKGGYLYVVNHNKNRVQKYDIKTSGNPFIRAYGTGADDVRMSGPKGVFVDDYTDIYISETAGNKIKVLKQHIIVPTAPTNLVATPNVTEMLLTWTAASPRTGTPLLDYVVEYKKTTEADWRRFGDGVGTNTTATITSLIANTEYQFRIFARNTAREDGDKSSVVTRATLNTLAPKAPTNLAAGIANRQINLSWTASNTNGGSAIKDYIVEYRLSSGGQWQVFNDGVRTTTTADVTVLTNDVRYDFRVKAENSTGAGAFSPYSTVVSRTPTGDDKCNDIAGIQAIVPQNLKRNTAGDCVCINEGIRATTNDPATCTLTCDARHTPAMPQFKVVYDEGYPRLYNNAQDTVGTQMTARRIIISDDADGTVWDTDTFIPLFKTNTQPFYDGALLQDPQRLSLARNGNELKVLWYGSRTDDKIERVKGRIIIEGSPDLKWTSIVEKNSVDDTDNVTIPASNEKVVRFDMVVNPANDSFVARYDLGSREDACIEKPLIIFNKNDTVATGTMGDKVMVPGTPTALTANAFVNPGYTFAGWATSATGAVVYTDGANYTMTVAANINLYAKWTPNISIKSIGSDTTAPYTTTDVTPDIVVNTPAATTQVTINGFTCIGVSNVLTQETEYTCTRTTAYANGNQTVTINATIPGGNRTIDATFTVNAPATYTVTFNSNGATTAANPTIKTVISPATTVGSLPTDPQRTGYTFDGWYDELGMNGGGAQFTASTLVTANITVYAKWTPVIVTHTVTYNGNSKTAGSVPVDAASPYINGTTVTVKANTGNLERTGFTFAGWNTAADGTGTNYAATGTATFIMGTTDVILYAKWTPIIPTHTVTYNGYGKTAGSVPVDVASPYVSGETVTVLGNTGNLTKTDYTFAGWNTQENGSGTNYTAGSTFIMGTTDVVLFAKWTPVIVTHTVTYNGNGKTAGSVPVDTASPYTNGSTVTVKANTGNLERNGFTFAGWSTTADGNGTHYAATGTATFTMSISDVILYAKWTPILPTHTVTYNGNGKTAGSVPVDAASPYTNGSTVTVLGNTGNLTRTGYTFAGWNTQENGSGTNYTAGSTFIMGATDVILLAKWTLNAYDIMTNAGANGSISPTARTVNHGGTTTFTVTPSAGYSIASVTGCGGILSGNTYTLTNVTGTCTMSATFALNSATTHTVTYNGNGSTYGLIPVDDNRYENGETVTVKTKGELEKTGHAFAGWNTLANGSGTSYAAGSTFTMGTTDVTLYAKWTDNVAPTVTLDLPATYTSLTVPVTIVPSETNVKYFFIEGPTPTSGLVPQDPTPPYTNAPGWITTLPTSYDFRAAGSRTLFVWVKDAAENVSTGLVSDVVVITLPDTTPPTITATSSNTTPLAIGETTTLTFTLSSASTNFTQDDITVVGGTLSQWTAVSSTVYTARFTPDTNRTTAGTINVAAGRFTNASGTSNTAMTQLSIQIDTVAPVTPAALTIPAQTGVTAWYYVTTDTFTVRVACTLGYTNKIYSRTIAAPTPVIINTTVCTNSTYMDVVINPGQASGFYSLSATITDTAGNASGQSNLINIYKDLPETAVTVPGTPDMDALYDFGTSSSDNLTRETQPRFTISCTSGNTVNLYDGTTNLIASGPCVANTAQMIPVIPLSAGTHSITAKQMSSTGILSLVSSALSITIDTTPLNVTITKAAAQTDPATSSSIQFVATFSRAIDANSFVCSDVTVIKGNCTSVTPISGDTYTINVTATSAGAVRAIIYAGRVETAAGNLNTESTGANTVTYGTGTNAQCNTALRTFSTSNPTNTSLNAQTLCTTGSPSGVSYSSAHREWTYTCNGTNGGNNTTCTVSVSNDSACTLKPVDELPFNSCSIGTSNGFFKFHSYLSCLNIVDEKASCTAAGCTQNAKRQDLIYIAARIRGIPLDLTSAYQCQKTYTDTVRGVPEWVCEVAEKANIADLITSNNTKFRPLDTMTRAEAFKVILGSICSYPTNTTSNWQTDVAKQAIKLGFSTRTVATFEPNRLLLKQELFTIAARAAEWLSENPDQCTPLPEELICE